MVKKIHFSEGKNDEKRMAPLLALSFVLVTIMSATILLPFQPLNAQNATIQMGNNTTTKDEIDVNVLESLAQPGFSNVYQKLTDREGNPVPISYNVVGGTAFAMVGDPS